MIYTDRETGAVLEARYNTRQIWLKVNCHVSKAELEEALKSNRYFKAIRSQASQQTCYPVFAAFKLFRQLNSAFNYAELVYRKRSREAVSVDVNRVLGGDRGLNNGLADSNSDCNGASNRISKVSTTLGLNFSGVSRESNSPQIKTVVS